MWGGGGRWNQLLFVHVFLLFFSAFFVFAASYPTLPTTHGCASLSFAGQVTLLPSLQNATFSSQGLVGRRVERYYKQQRQRGRLLRKRRGHAQQETPEAKAGAKDKPPSQEACQERAWGQVPQPQETSITSGELSLADGGRQEDSPFGRCLPLLSLGCTKKGNGKKKKFNGTKKLFRGGWQGGTITFRYQPRRSKQGGVDLDSPRFKAVSPTGTILEGANPSQILLQYYNDCRRADEYTRLQGMTSMCESVNEVFQHPSNSKKPLHQATVRCGCPRTHTTHP